MIANPIDHVNLRYPEDELEAALEFYCEKLGFEPELVGYDEDGDPYVDHPSHFSVRLGEECLIHMTPTADPQILNRYEDADRTSLDHVGLLLDRPIEEIKRDLEAADIEILREFEPGGATGVAPAVFVLDPFGYMLEFKVDPERLRERNAEIWERHRRGEDHADIAADLDTTEAAVRRVATYYRESGRADERRDRRREDQAPPSE